MQNRPEPPPPEPPRDPRQPADFEPVALGRHLLRAVRVGALGTLDRENGFPITTLVSVATDLDGAPLILVSGLSHHTKNLLSDLRCSLLLAEGGRGDPLAHPRLTLTARAEPVQDEISRRRFLARHPKAKLYVDFPDFSLWRLELQRMQLNGGFARAFDGDGRLILSELGDRAAFAQLEASILAGLNADQAASLSDYAQVLCGLRGGAWRATGLDPDGLDLALGDQTARIAFRPPLRDEQALQSGIEQLNRMVRAKQKPPAGGEPGEKFQ